jgi:membrane protease YdiL (CAAX protease family)
VVLSSVVLVLAASVQGEYRLLVDPDKRMDWIAEFAGSSLGLAVLVLPGQLVFAAAALVAAALSRDPWRDRLGLHAGRLPGWTWLLFLLGTPTIGMLSARLISALADEPNRQLKLLERILEFDSLAVLAVLLLLVSLLPGVVEELLFRGYLQRRLLSRWHPVFAIGVCSVLFAAAHMDPMYAVGVLPLGIWLGIVAWRADSIWPAIVGHVGNNGFAIVISQLVELPPRAAQGNPVAAVLLGGSALSLVAAIAALALLGGRRAAALPR